MCLTKKALCDLAGYTYHRLYDIEKDLPEEKRFFVKGEGGYDLALFVRRWVDYNVDKARAGSAESLDEVKAQHEGVKMRKTEMEVERMAGQLLDVEDVRETWLDIAVAIKQGLLSIPSKLAPQLVMLGDAEIIESMILREVEGALTALADEAMPERRDEAQGDEPT